MSTVEKLLNNIKGILFALRAFSFGTKGRIRIDAGETYDATKVIAVKAITDDFTYGDGCIAEFGEAPTLNDPLLQGDVDIWPAEAVEAETGSAWVYIG